MKSFAWLRTHPRAIASTSAVTVAAVTLTTMAFVYQGFPTTEVDLNDGGVWVTKQSSLLVGHFNHESQLLDGGLRTTSDNFDILQSGTTVFVVNNTDASVTSVDPAMVALTDSADVPAGANVALGGSTVAILDPSSGDLWAVPSDGMAGFQVQGTDPLATLGKDAAVTVGTDGAVYAVSSESKELLTIHLDPSGAVPEPQVRKIDDLTADGPLSITAVGTTAVVLDSGTGTIFTSDGRSIPVDGGETAALQQPSTATASVALATAGTLVSVPLDGSEVSEISSGAQGTPAAPVSLKGCVYAAWSGSAKFVRDCIGDDDDLASDIDGVDAQSVLRFRVNREVVVLNDIIGGAAWMASDSMQRVDNWNEITPPEGDSEEDEQTTEETVETTLPERTDVNTAPIATDDEFGVRPGRTTVLPVLDNDTDADGDVLTASLPDGNPSLGDVQPINNGAALQIAVPENATGSDSFTYEINDGREGTDTATVRLAVHDWDTNAGPKQNRITTVTVEAGGTVSYNVLPDWIDPDGDDIFLGSVTPADGDEADFTSDGRITYRAIGITQGRKDVTILVSDGSKVTEGTVRFDVRPVGSTLPVTNPDHYVVQEGQTVTVAPLANDTSSSSEPLRLTRVDEIDGTTIVPDFANKSFSFSSATPKTYYVQYLVSAGANAVPGIVRIDVLPASDAKQPPVAVRDVALLPSGGEVLVNVLANDNDPAGGILVVQSVTLPPNSGIAVAVLNHETLRISDQAALGGQVRISYRISNGTDTAEGEVIVIPVPAPAQLRPPVANDDQVVVRAGDIVTIPVLANDYHPNGDTIHVAPDLIAPLVAPEDGEMFVSQDTLRFRASATPGTVYATYEVIDSTGQRDAGYVTIQVLPVNTDTNTAPRPRDLTARVLSGQRVQVAVPLDGIDQDGDSVELIGLASAPKKGRIVETGPNFLVYEAFADSTGLDTFTYRVRDRPGKEATAPIRIGIAPPESTNQAPYAVKDSVIMRPGRTVAVPVLLNDSDPDGDRISLLSDGLVLPDVDGLTAKVESGRVVVTSPDQPTQTSIQYTIVDSRGARASAVLQITVAEDVPLLRPIARDDRVRAEDVKDDTVDIEVLANDEDPDGTASALKVAVTDGVARVLGDGKLRVELGETSQLITYRVTDRDGLSASAFVHVPSLAELPPTLTASVDAIEVQSGATIEIPLAKYVQAAGGKKVVITEAAKVAAVHSNGISLVKDQSTLVYTSAAGYFGADAITFEVTDGTGPDDPAGRKAVLTLPVTVLPPSNQQPSFTSGQVDVAPGEDAASLDLLALTTDPDRDDLPGMRYSLVGGAPSGLTATVDGQRLSVSAASSTAKGTTATLKVRIDDGETEPIEGTVTVRVTASTRAVPTANDDSVPEAPQGKSVSVPVLANDFNPFPETPLKITTAITETGQGDVEVVGDQVRVTPDKTFFGTMVVRYRIQDATGDVDREVEGRIRLTVQGRPDAPGTPTVSSVQDRTVVLSWTPPADNGAAIEKYTVKSVAGNYTKTCASTTCTLDGLTNNVEYNFTVTATNRVNESDPSVPSQTARPDARPDTPQPPTLVFGDRSLQVAWVTPTTPGSPVETFTLEISPAPPSGVAQKSGQTGNTLVWEGLENGASYQVRVRAHNRAPEPSSWSVWSANMVPAAPPAAPAAPSTTRLDPVPPQAQMQVSWNRPAENGDTIDGYELNILRGGSLVRTVPVPAGQLSQALAIEASTTDYSFTVRAHNKAGWGPVSAASAPRRAFVAPGAPTNVQASTPTGDSAIVVTYGEAPGNGANAGELRYEYNVGGGWRNDWDGRRITAGIANNNSYTVSVRAYTALDGVRYDGAPASAAAAAAPYGPVNTPGAGATNNGTSVTVSWGMPGANGRPISRLEISINGGGWENVGAAGGSRVVGSGYQQTWGIQVRAIDSANQVSATASASARTNDPPQPTARLVKGNARAADGYCSHSSCAFFRLTVTDFPAGNYRLVCNESGDPGFASKVYSVPANGSVDLTCFMGYPGRDAWIDIEGWGQSQHMTWY